MKPQSFWSFALEQTLDLFADLWDWARGGIIIVLLICVLWCLGYALKMWTIPTIIGLVISIIVAWLGLCYGAWRDWNRRSPPPVDNG